MTTNYTYGLLDIMGDGAMLGQSGSLTVSFRLTEPECYSLSPEDIDRRNLMLEEAFRFLPDGSYVHKQDIFLKRSYSPEKAGSFLSRADARHFAGRTYLEHTCLMHFTFASLETLEKAYAASPVRYREELHRNDEQKLKDFLEGVENAMSIIRNIPNVSVRQLDGTEMVELMGEYTNLFGGKRETRDMRFSSTMSIGEEKVKYYSICDEAHLPEGIISSCVRDYSLPKAGSELFHTPLESLGVYLPCNHIVNQVIFFEGDKKLRARVNSNIDVYKKNSSIRKSIESEYRKLDEVRNEIMEENTLLVRTYFSLCFFDRDEKELENAEKKIRECLNLAGFGYYIPSFEHLAAAHLASVPGQVNCLPGEYMFLSTLSVSLCLFLACSTLRSDAEGIQLQDRLYRIPIKKDIWDAGKRRADARNGMIIAGSGGGKSTFAENFTYQLLEQDYTVVVVEFGKSFSQLCKLYPKESLHVDYDGKTPLGINPFDLQGRRPDNTDLETISGIVQRYWKHMFTGKEPERETALNLFIEDYYEQPGKEHNFVGFYNHVKQNYPDILERKNIPEKYFELSSFLLNCGEFLPGKRYENVTKDTKEDFLAKKFIVFELTRIKQDRFLSNLVMTMIFSVIQSKILSDRSKRGILIFDEYAETAQMKDTATNTGIHSSVAFCYQKIRKENGAVYTIVQTPDQLPDDENTQNIIGNTDMLYVLPTKEVIYSSIIEKFKITDQAHIDLMKSMRNNFSGRQPYSECFLRMGEKYATVTRLELSPEKFLAFQTEGSIWAELEKKTQRMGMEDAIREYLEEHPERKVKKLPSNR